MLTPAVIHEIERLLEEGQHSRRKIAKIAKVAPGTVTAVATGERRADDYLEKMDHRKPLGEAKRCPSCFATVRMPCRLCQTRELMAGKRLPQRKRVIDTPIGLNLKPEHQARYAEVRRWRREALRIGLITRPHSDLDVDSLPS